MLNTLQKQLSDMNGVDPGRDVRDFVVTDRAVAVALSQGKLLTNTNETVLVAEEDDGVALSVFLDKSVLARFCATDALPEVNPESLDDLWAVIEGISHFNYLAASAKHDRPVTLLELELQAEVDKYAATLALLAAQGDTDHLRRLHDWLFEAVSYRADLDHEQLERYQTANDYASRFCYQLRDGFITGSERATRELRKFSSASQQGKISHVHRLAWSP